MRTRRYWLPEAEESIMSALIAALYADHQTADRVRLRLSTGDIAFPADRVHLTSISEPGHAGLVPAESFALKLRAYFQTLFDRDEEAGRVLSLGAAVQGGQATVVVFPRGAVETKRAREVLRQAKPLEVYEHAIEEQTLERAASDSDSPVVSKAVDALPGANRPGP
jgi:hypothetical protein